MFLPRPCTSEQLLVRKLSRLCLPDILGVLDAITIEDKVIECLLTLDPVHLPIMICIRQPVENLEEVRICLLLDHCSIDSLDEPLHLLDRFLLLALTKSESIVPRVVVWRSAARVTTCRIKLLPALIFLTYLLIHDDRIVRYLFII